MPVIPSGSDFPAQQGNSDNNAPNQEQRNSDQGTQKATMLDHLSKGPQIPDSMPPKVPREEIEARMKELNK
ncbi:uncharacterized protein BO88DRAFT_451776 [Aspergillus vadensis CBS 113365]|uniref:Uncharacterized protein n=1 Tax=Aspergillus vadensis (strain CBS 113365 / IMI 142717 / IBT 24658) TaxID=1448311 RepID=A0A319CS19_ASPVC|nr:hypothetical protein BO88DRAFT_451776 [Aspergillus vadensis CBS 113365]PYH71092.1 hypothetical protein BO88DRAFT_451776 [Aspergillus vadensis CBS 113365]